MGRPAKHQPHPSEATRRSGQRDARLLLQVQRPAVRQGREARDHDQARDREERRHVFERAQGVRRFVVFGSFQCSRYLRRYASEVDVDFVRKAVRAIGQCAIKIEAAAERCVNVLLDLISTRVSYVVQESIVVIKVRPISSCDGRLLTQAARTQDIFRKYPQQYEGIIPTLCASLDELDEPEAKASLIWILGEYADKIENADELIGTFLDNYAEEPIQVRRCLWFSRTERRSRPSLAAGSTPGPHRGRQALPSEARIGAGARSTRLGSRDQDGGLA